MLSVFPLAPVPIPVSAYLETLGRRVDPIDPGLMTAGGWSLIDQLPLDTDVVFTRVRVDRAIVKAWPATVRLTFSSAVISIWEHPNPPPDNPTGAPFPTPVDTAHALRVMEAVGVARASAYEDRLAALAGVAGSGDAMAEIRTELNAEQLRFEAVAAALRAFSEAK